MAEFQGAIYEADRPVSGNRKAEMALVYLAMTADGLCGDLLDRVEPRDFCYDDCRFVFNEISAMHKTGVPTTDKAAQASWFLRPDVVQAMRKEKLDWFDESNQPLPAVAIFEIVVNGEFASVANLEWYIQELRRWRVVRGLRMMAWDLSKAIDDHEPMEVVGWLEEKIDQIKAVAEPLMAKA